MDFSKRLKEERLLNGLTQKQLSAIGDVSELMQIRYEQGKVQPNSSYLINLYSAGLDVNYIITGERNTTNKEVQTLIKSFLKSDPLIQQMVLRILGLDADLLQKKNRKRTKNKGLKTSSSCSKKVLPKIKEVKTKPFTKKMVTHSIGSNNVNSNIHIDLAKSIRKKK